MLEIIRNKLKILKFSIPLTCILLILNISPLVSDSPITSTFFREAYSDIEIVQYARETAEVDRRIATFLSDTKNRLDEKAALINAISWDFDGKNNAEKYLNILKKKKRVYDRKVFDELNPHEIFAYGYLLVIDDYFYPENAIPYLELAQEKLPQSTTVAMMLALTRSQIDLDSNWCAIWKNCEAVFYSDKLNYDMRISALFIILDYIKLYKSACDK